MGKSVFGRKTVSRKSRCSLIRARALAGAGGSCTLVRAESAESAEGALLNHAETRRSRAGGEADFKLRPGLALRHPELRAASPQGFSAPPRLRVKSPSSLRPLRSLRDNQPSSSAARA